MLREVRETGVLVARNPAVTVGGLVLAVAQIAQYLLVGRPMGGTGSLLSIPHLATVAAVQQVWILLAPFPLAGLYALCRDARSETHGERRERPVGRNVRRATERFVAAGRAAYAPLLAATILYKTVAVLFALGIAVALDAVLFLAVTNGVIPVGRLPVETLSDSVVVVTGGAALLALSRVGGALPFRFYDLFVLFSRDAATTCWATSARFAKERPRRLLEYGVVSAVPVLVPVGVAVAVHATVSPLFAAGSAVPSAIALASYLPLGGLGWTLAGAYHVVFFERVVSPAVSPTGPDGVAVLKSLLRERFSAFDSA